MTRSHADPHSSAAVLRLPDTTLVSHAIGPRRLEPRGTPARPAASPPEVAAARREAPQSSSHRPPSPHRYRQPRRARSALTGGSWAAPVRPPSPRPWRGPARPRPAGAERRARPRPCRYGDPPPRRPAPAAMGAAQGQTTARGAAPPGPVPALPRPRVAPLCRMAAPGRRCSWGWLYAATEIGVCLSLSA